MFGSNLLGMMGTTALGGIVAVKAGPSAVSSWSSDGITWTDQTMPASRHWYKVAYGNNTFVAVASGPTDKCATSPDGKTWTERTLPISKDWFCVAWGGTQFVAIGGTGTGTNAGYCATSPDGVTWTQRTLPFYAINSDITGCSWNGAVFCAVTNYGHALISADGITWRAYTMPKRDSWKDVVWMGTQWVAVRGNSPNNIATSPDGRNWTIRTGVPATLGTPYCIAWNGTSLVVLEGSNGFYTSTDAINWTNRTNPGSAGNWNSVTWDGTQFIGINGASASEAVTSPTGATWTLRTLSSSGSWNSVAAAYTPTITTGSAPSSNKIMALNYGSTLGNISADNGATWSAITLPSAANWDRGAYNGSLWLIISDGTACATSTDDGASWTTGSLPSSHTWSILTCSESLFIAWVQNGSNIYATSADGINWTSRTMPASKSWIAAQYNAYYGYYSVMSADGAWYYSTTGTGSWTLVTMPTHANYRGLAYNRDVVVATGDTFCATSANGGTTWTSRTIGAGWWFNLGWNGTVFCAMDVSTNKVTTSPDGITWTARTNSTSGSNANFGVLPWNGEVFCQVYNSSSTAATSPDGLTWTTRTMHDSAGWNGIITQLYRL